jgi:hypothetical protein
VGWTTKQSGFDCLRDRIFSLSLNVEIVLGGRDTSPTLKGTSGSLSQGLKLLGFESDGDRPSCAEVRKL